MNQLDKMYLNLPRRCRAGRERVGENRLKSRRVLTRRGLELFVEAFDIRVVVIENLNLIEAEKLEVLREEAGRTVDDNNKGDYERVLSD